MTDQTSSAAASEPVAPVKEQALQVSRGVKETSFGAKGAVQQDQIPQYKATKGRVDRIAILDPALLMTARVHTDFSDNKAEKGLGYVICKTAYKQVGGMDVPLEPATCCKNLDDAKQRCATFIIRYGADAKTGQPLAPVDVQLQGWAFPPAKYETLAAIHEEFAKRDESGAIIESGLLHVDLIIKCEDTDYQKIEMIASPQCIRKLPQFQEKFGATIEAFTMAMRPKLAGLIGRERTDKEILERAGKVDGTVRVGSVEKMEAPSEIAALFA